MNIPDGVRLCENVTDAECKVCKLTTEDHTVNMSFPIEHYGIAYQKVCLKDWAQYKKKLIKEVPAMTMEEPKENIEAKVEIISDGKVISPKKAREELRINIIIKGDHIIMGAQATDCDPRMTALQGDLTAALARIPAFIEESNAAWDVSAKNPKSSIAEPTPPPSIPRTASTSTASKPAAAKTPPAQKAFF